MKRTTTEKRWRWGTFGGVALVMSGSFDAGAEHAWDFVAATVALALAAGATLVHQSFTTRGLAPSRTAASASVLKSAFAVRAALGVGSQF